MTIASNLRSAFRRWVNFNLVGLLGVGVQLATLTLLRIHGVHYLLATALAVEAAVVHNFAWHERWTWLDRTTGDPSRAGSRLLRFNLTVGVVSIAENLFFMKLLVGWLGIHYLPANLISITICSVLNFFISDRLVFNRSRVTRALLPRQGILEINCHNK